MLLLCKPLWTSGLVTFYNLVLKLRIEVATCPQLRLRSQCRLIPIFCWNSFFWVVVVGGCSHYKALKWPACTENEISKTRCVYGSKHGSHVLQNCDVCHISESGEMCKTLDVIEDHIRKWPGSDLEKKIGFVLSYKKQKQKKDQICVTHKQRVGFGPLLPLTQINKPD